MINAGLMENYFVEIKPKWQVYNLRLENVENLFQKQVLTALTEGFYNVFSILLGNKCRWNSYQMTMTIILHYNMRFRSGLVIVNNHKISSQLLCINYFLGKLTSSPPYQNKWFRILRFQFRLVFYITKI